MFCSSTRPFYLLCLPISLDHCCNDLCLFNKSIKFTLLAKTVHRGLTLQDLCWLVDVPQVAALPVITCFTVPSVSLIDHLSMEERQMCWLLIAGRGSWTFIMAWRSIGGVHCPAFTISSRETNTASAEAKPTGGLLCGGMESDVFKPYEN